MRKFLLLTTSAAFLGFCYMLANDPPSTVAAPDYGRICRAEAGSSRVDQDDCRAKHALGAAFGAFSQQDSAKQISARR